MGLVECFGAPRRHLQLLHPNLDPLLFDRLDTVEAISAFLRSSRTTRMQIIIQDSSLIVARGHRLIELARRLDSHLEIRKSPDDTATNVQSFMTWDNRGYWHMPDFRAYQVLRNDYDPVHATRLGEQFSRLWSRSTPDPELRVLRL